MANQEKSEIVKKCDKFNEDLAGFFEKSLDFLDRVVWAIGKIKF